jgi:hypothetical protein
MSLRRSPRLATVEKPKSVEVQQPLRRSARLAEKAKRVTLGVNPELVVNPDLIVNSVLNILIKCAYIAHGARGVEKENALVTLFQYFKENLDYIQSKLTSGLLIQIYNEKLSMAKEFYPNNAELQAL